MDDMNLSGGTEYYLEPGYIYLSKQPTVVRTVLGSCVAVCLWDRNLRYGGMNHFLHPYTYEPEKATPRYGNVATSALVRMMEEAGCQRADIVAQVLGGGHPPAGTGYDVGEENARVARVILKRKGINIVSEDVGGSMGRKLVFDTGTGELVVFKVHSLRESDWFADREGR